MPELSSARRSELRAQAHALSPVVFVGDKGLTDAVVAEIDRALKAHELVKVKAAAGDRDQRAAWMADICARLGAHPVQSIGKVLVLWRENPQKTPPPAPPPARKPARKPAGKPTGAKKGRAKAPPAPRQAKPAEESRRRPRAGAAPRDKAVDATRTARRRSRLP